MGNHGALGVSTWEPGHILSYESKMYQCIAYEIIICNNNNIYFDNVSEYRKTSQGSALHPYGRMALHHLQVSLNLCPEDTKGRNDVAFADTLPANESKLAAFCSMVEFGFWNPIFQRSGPMVQMGFMPCHGTFSL